MSHQCSGQCTRRSPFPARLLHWLCGGHAAANRLQVVSAGPAEVSQLTVVDFRLKEQGGVLPVRKFPLIFRKHLPFHCFNRENKPKNDSTY